MPSRPPRLVTRRVGSLLLLYQGPDAPSDAEWDANLALLRPIVATARVLVITHGGGPSAAQRGRLSQVIGKHRVVSAVVTDSVAVRFAASVVALFVPSIRCFGATDREGAYRHLQLDAAEREMAERNLAEMRVQVMGESVPISAPRSL